MASAVLKRPAAAVNKKEPPPKKVAVASPVDEFVASRCDRIGSALEGASNLPESVRAMLSSMAASSLCVAKDERHRYHSASIDIVGEALAEIETLKFDAVNAARSKVESANKDRQDCEVAAVSARATLEALKETAARDKAALEADAAALSKATAALKAAEVEQKRGDASLDTLSTSRDKLAKAETELYAPLKGSGTESADGKAKLKQLDAVLKDTAFTFDSALVEIVPAVVKKAAGERGAFDQTALEQLDMAFSKELAALDAKIHEGPAAREQRASAVAAAAAAATAAREKEEATAATLRSSMAAEREGRSALAAAEKSAQAFLPNLKDSTVALEAAEATLEKFRKDVMDAFRELIEYAPPAPQTQEAKPAAEAASA